VEEARRVLDRLDRVEHLHLAGAPAQSLLAELRELLAETERWLAVEGPGAEDAARALDRCRDALRAPAQTGSVMR
jgi:hypothetical protein